MVAKAERSVGMSYGEIKASLVLRLKPKMAVHAANHLNQYDMMNVQRLSPCRRVKPQANGGRKIWLLEIGCINSLISYESMSLLYARYINCDYI